MVRRAQQVLSTGAEGKVLEFQRAESERQKAERFAERLRELGINLDEV